MLKTILTESCCCCNLYFYVYARPVSYSSVLKNLYGNAVQKKNSKLFCFMVMLFLFYGYVLGDSLLVALLQTHYSSFFAFRACYYSHLTANHTIWHIYTYMYRARQTPAVLESSFTYLFLEYFVPYLLWYSINHSNTNHTKGNSNIYILHILHVVYIYYCSSIVVIMDIHSFIHLLGKERCILQ